jgi:hypothetical protein
MIRSFVLFEFVVETTVSWSHKFVNVIIIPQCLTDNKNYSENRKPCGNESVLDIIPVFLSSVLLVHEIFFLPVNTNEVTHKCLHVNCSLFLFDIEVS